MMQEDAPCGGDEKYFGGRVGISNSRFISREVLPFPDSQVYKGAVGVLRLYHDA